MAVETQAVQTGAHVVQFYEHDADLAWAVGSYLVDGIRDGAVAIVIATGAHRHAFEAELEDAGIDPAEASRAGRLVSLDAATTIAAFMPGGAVDPDAFHRVIGAVMRDAAETGRPVRAYGEMVSLLWDAGDVLAAIELEKLWNDLGRECRFSLLCAYRSQSISGSEHGEALQEVCHLHSSVIHAPNRPADDPRRRNHEVVAEFPAESDAPGAARRFVTDVLRQWGHDGSLLDDAQLVLSELATNAVIHARSPFSVVARSEDSGVRVSVRDSSRIRPTLREEGPTALAGRGLLLVGAVASDWGVEVTADGKTVWATLRA